MIEEVTAARKALDQVALQMVRRHIDNCVSDAITRRDGAGKIDELMQTIHRFVK